MTNFTTIAQIEASETKDLVIYFNKNSTKTIKKFTDRATAVRRCVDLMMERGEWVEGATEEAAEVEADDLPEVRTEAQKEADKKSVWPFPVGGVKSEVEKTSGDEEGLVLENGVFTNKPEAKEKTKPIIKKSSSHASNSAGIAASWADSSVAAARLQRDSVSVTVKGVVSSHKSTRSAFRHFRLMDSKHIRFRGILKAAGSATYTENGVDYLFAIL
jgi:hypothetical protein